MRLRKPCEHDLYDPHQLAEREPGDHRKRVWCPGGEFLPEDAVADLLQTAWGVIANAGGGNWDNETSEWVGAAERWREQYHAFLGVGEPG